MLESRLGDFFGVPFDLPRVNETRAPSAAARPILAEELDEPTLAALRARSRLDAVLWGEVVAGPCSPATPELAGERALLRCLFHYADAGVTRVSGSAAEVAREQAVSRLPVVEAERDLALAQVAAAEAERKQALANAEAAAAERERVAERVAAMQGSLSWRVTAPLRALSRGIRSVLHL
jgi:hypothetical protein